MTQTDPRTLTRAQLKPGTQVTHLTDDQLVAGEIISSDAWYDTLKLRGVAPNQQVLVAWETSSDSGAPVPLWARITDLAQL